MEEMDVESLGEAIAMEMSEMRGKEGVG